MNKADIKLGKVTFKIRIFSGLRRNNAESIFVGMAIRTYVILHIYKSTNYQQKKVHVANQPGGSLLSGCIGQEGGGVGEQNGQGLHEDHQYKNCQMTQYL